MHGNDELEFYRDEAGEIRWKYTAAGNHALLAEGGEGYKRLESAMRSAYRVVNIADPDRHALLASATDRIGANRADGSAVDVVLNGV